MAGANWARKGRTRPDPRLIEDHEILTQYGQEGPDGSEFKGQPRFDDAGERDLSMLLGKMDAAEALGYIASHKTVSDRDSVRYFQVGALRESGYVITHTPSLKNPYHISVTAPEDCDPRQWWKEEGEPLLRLLRQTTTDDQEGDG
ncbi:MAG TPA: hypothetical protein VFX16_14640 [Pseudonocardiaceae bacterium]|nr:hypothetical protein [Pseudonocardiaceae bacterium]